MATTLFALRSDDGGIFDASSSVSLKTAGARPGLRADRAFTLAKTTRVSIAPTEAFDALGTFTLALVVTPENLRVNQVLVDSERGVLLRCASRLNGEDFDALEVEEIRFDERFPEDVFDSCEPLPWR